MPHPAHPRAPRRSHLAALALLAAFPVAGTAQSAAAPDFSRRGNDASIDAARDRTLAQCRAKGLALPADFLAWVDGDPLRRASVYGWRQEPLPVLLGLRSLEIDLGEALVRRDYPQLALAFAIQGSYRAPSPKASGWNDGDGDPANGELPDLTPRPPLQLVIPGDPRVRVDTKAKDRPLDRDDHIVNFLEDHDPIEVEVTDKELPPLEYDAQGRAKPRGKPVAVTKKVRRGLVAADVIASTALQAEFGAYMAAHGHPEVTIECGDRVVHWASKEAVRDGELRKRIAAAHELFHTAYRNKGRMPAERDRAPTPAESMAWLVRNDHHDFTPERRQERQWPRFPLQAPWPVLLMLAADDQPLREREEIWTKFRDHGEFRTYGEYIDGIAQQFDMQSARRVSPFAFAYGSIQMMWKDGGVCGTMGNIGARTYRIVGVPASTAGQPGHCAIVYFTHDAKTGYRCKGGQYATGGDEVTTVHAGWNYDERGGRRPMVYHQAVAFGVNHGAAAWVDTLVLRRRFDQLDATTRAQHAVAFVSAALAQNPFALPCIEAALVVAPQATAAVAVLDACNEHLTARRGDEFALYRRQVRDLAHQRVLALPATATPEATTALLSALERQGCEEPTLLARCWRALGGEAGFTKHCAQATERYLASTERQQDKRAPERFAAMLHAWEKTVPKGPARQAWAEALLVPFAGKETLPRKGKAIVDPAVLALCKVAGRKPPTSGGAQR